LISDPLPECLSIAFIERIDDPAMLRPITRRITITIESRSKSSLGIAAYGCGHEDTVTPNDWAGVGKTRYRSSPKYVFAGLRIPTVWEVLVFGYA
jgi:hypothetical protein